MRRTREADFERVKNQSERISWPLALLGIWPKRLTSCSRLKFTIFITCVSIQLLMELNDLIRVLGNLEAMVGNLMESGFHSMSILRILIIRFDKEMRNVIDTIERDLVIERCRDAEEMTIFLQYSSIVETFHRTGTTLAAITALAYGVAPFPKYIRARLMNDTAVLTLPLRVYPSILPPSIERTVIAYALQLPTILLVVLYVTCSAILLRFIMNLCAYLAILRYRISTMKPDSDPRVVFHQHTQQHVQIQGIMRSLNDIFQLFFLYELVLTSVIIGLIIYLLLVSIDNADAFTACVLLMCIGSMITFLFINCFMGECINTECAALLNAYYDCNWYEMSPSYKNALLICMNTSQKPIQLTAGKLYVFSLDNFKKAIKSSMMYVSMLRTLI